MVELDCQNCGRPLHATEHVAQPAAPGQLFCRACGMKPAAEVATSAGVSPAELLSGTEPAGESPASSAGSTLGGRLLYGLSLPERLVRGAIGLSAGAAREVAEFLVPQAFKDSASYRLAIENSLGFLTETIGGVARPGKTAEPAAVDAGETIARKAVGNFVDLAGLATLHVSPMWMLAVVSDVAYGTKTFTQELARELQAQGVIDDSSTIHHVDDILAAVQRTCGTASGTFDQPPLSLDELRKTIDEARRSLSDADLRRLIPEAELRTFWQEMRSVAEAEHVSLLGVSATLTMQTLNRVKSAGQTAMIGAQIAGGLFNRNVVGHYREALSRVQDAGLIASVRESYTPYVAAVWENFSTERKTWTETLLDPATASGWLQKLKAKVWNSTTDPPS